MREKVFWVKKNEEKISRVLRLRRRDEEKYKVFKIMRRSSTLPRSKR
jgi:hypothetical protein